MNSSNVLLALLNTTAFLLCVGFLVYILCILRPFLRRRDAVPGRQQGHTFHFVVPCLNEEQVIGATVRHLVSSFPAATLWIVDDGSTDGTPAVLAELAAAHPAVHVLTRTLPDARKGKGAALNAAWRAIDAATPDDVDRDSVIVGVLDADARLERICPDVICGREYFADPAVVAVQVQVRITSDVDALVTNDLGTLAARSGRRRQDPILVQLQDLEFVGPIAAMQTLRRRTGSAGMGGNGQFTRLSGLNRIALEYGTPWHGALLEDFELGLHVLLSGGRTEYCDETFVAQAGLESVRPLIRQRSRWSQGGMQCMQYLLPVLRSPIVPLPGALEIAYYLFLPWTQLLGSIVFPVALVLDCYYAFGTDGGVSAWWRAGAWGIAPLAVLFGALPYLVWGPLYRLRSGGTVTWRRSVLLSVANIGYGYLLQAAVWWAFIRLVRRRTDWKKTAHPGTTAAPPSAAVPAAPPPAPAAPRPAAPLPAVPDDATAVRPLLRTSLPPVPAPRPRPGTTALLTRGPQS